MSLSKDENRMLLWNIFYLKLIFWFSILNILWVSCAEWNLEQMTCKKIFCKLKIMNNSKEIPYSISFFWLSFQNIFWIFINLTAFQDLNLQLIKNSRHLGIFLTSKSFFAINTNNTLKLYDYSCLCWKSVARIQTNGKINYWNNFSNSKNASKFIKMHSNKLIRKFYANLALFHALPR